MLREVLIELAQMHLMYVLRFKVLEKTSLQKIMCQQLIEHGCDTIDDT